MVTTGGLYKTHTVHYYVMMVNTGGAPVSLSSASYTHDSMREIYFKIGCVYGGGDWIFVTG